jgi:hypothetical protein
MNTTRRDFNRQLLSSVVACGLIESLFSRHLFADAVKPIVGPWLTDLSDMTRELRDRKMTDLEFQAKMEALYRRVDLPELIKHIDLEAYDPTKLPDNGASSRPIDFSKIEGAPSGAGFNKQIFGVKQGCSIVPHGHTNMCTGFIILRGEFHGRHYDRVETHEDHCIIRPSIDRIFKPGELSTVSDHKDNVHWFKATSGAGFIFNVHVDSYDPSIKAATGRNYLDPEGEKLAGGLIKAPAMTSNDCHKKFG